MSGQHKRGNQVLDLLSSDDYARLAPKLSPVDLEVNQVIYEMNRQIEFAYFPLSGALSAVVVMEDGGMIEVGTVGNEGAVGLPTYGASDISVNRVFVQVKGRAMKIAAHELAKVSFDSEHFRLLIGRYQATFNFQVSRSVACNGLHNVQQRCARWLLMTHDRVQSDEVYLTHEFLGIMLGVRRASVTEVLQTMQEQGLILGGRGKIVILDRLGLEKIACECSAAVEHGYARMLQLAG